MSKFKQVVMALLFGISSFAAGQAMAQTALAPGGILFESPVGTLQNGDDYNSWGYLAVSGPSAFVDTVSPPPANFSGNITSGVISGDTFNPYGGLTFVYQFENFGPDAIERLTITGFGDFKTSVAYNPSYLNTPMGSVDRSSDGNNIGVSWAGVAGVAPNGWGLLAVYTDATVYSLNQAFLQDGGQAFTSVYAPVPEPEIYAMLLAGLGFMGFVARRRKQVAA